MKYDFDAMVDRRNTFSTKWEFYQADEELNARHTDMFLGEAKAIPMWVADMDFKTPQPVIDALVARAQHGIFGYAGQTDEYFDAVIGWVKRRHDWSIEKEWICNTSGVVPAIYMALRAFLSPGDKVLIQPPVYYPFKKSIENSGFEVVDNPLIHQGWNYQMDFDDLAQKASDPRVKMAILSNPHNPVGKVWSREALRRFGQICQDNDVLVIADEIHGDLILNGVDFAPFASLSPLFAQNSITCIAPSKTFNLAGLKTSAIIIPNEKLRTRYTDTMKAHGTLGISAFGIVGLVAAYNHGEEWLKQLLVYLADNFQFLCDYLAQHLPQLKVSPLEGTYLVWIDCRGLGLSSSEQKTLWREKAGLYFDDGYIFGQGGDGFQRLNIACPRSQLAEALRRMKEAVDSLDRGA